MLLDIGAGILLGLWLGPSHSTLFNVLFGVLFTLLPDSDTFIYFYLRKHSEKFHQKLQDHRVFFHYPLPYLLIGIVIILLVYPPILPLFIFGTIEQFLHDSIGPGWGIPWLYPFYKRYFKFFYQLDLSIAKQPQKIAWVWSKEEQDRLTREYGDADWSKHKMYFFKATPLWWIFELLVFVIALITLAVHR